MTAPINQIIVKDKEPINPMIKKIRKMGYTMGQIAELTGHSMDDICLALLDREQVYEKQTKKWKDLEIVKEKEVIKFVEVEKIVEKEVEKKVEIPTIKPVEIMMDSHHSISEQEMYRLIKEGLVIFKHDNLHETLKFHQHLKNKFEVKDIKKWASDHKPVCDCGRVMSIRAYKENKVQYFCKNCKIYKQHAMD